MKVRWVPDQRGSVLVLNAGIIVGAVAFSLILFDIYAVYIGRRVAQSAADAAALGALEVLRQESHKEVIVEADRQFQAHMEEIQAEVTSRVDAWEQDRRSELIRRLLEDWEMACPPSPSEPVPPNSPPPDPCPDYSSISEEENRIVAEERPEVRRQYFRSVVRKTIRHADLENAIIQGTTPEAGWLISEFLTARDMACVVNTAGARSREEWENTANHFASVNGGQSIATEFPYDGRVAIAVTVPVRLHLLVFDSLLPDRLRYVDAIAVVQINSFGPYPVDVRAAC